MADDDESRRARLAKMLRILRAGQRQDELAARLGWGQSKVSKLETGLQLPTTDDLAAWAGATDPAALGDLAALHDSAVVEYEAYRVVTRERRGLAAHQAALADAEARATRIEEYQPGLIPGFAQTPQYATELLALAGGPAGAAAPPDDEQIADIVTARMRRGDVLYRGDRDVTLLIGEAALWAAPGTVETLRGQLGKLQTLADLPRVQLGVVPRRVMPVMPLSGFRILDRERVIVESLAGEQTLVDAADVAGFTRSLELLRTAARTGPDAAAAVRDVLAELGGA